MKCILIRFALLFILTLSFSSGFAKEKDSIAKSYNECFEMIHGILKDNGSFKKAVFLAENVYQKGMSEQEYYHFIDGMTTLAKLNRKQLHAVNYSYNDSNDYLLNKSILSVICGPFEIKGGLTRGRTIPFTYSFADPIGKNDWSNMFVMKAFKTRKGNCHSFAYLYKILADELAVKSWLALAPNHIYIKSYSKKIGWYNTELTSGTFPTDAWLAASGYISGDAIRSGIYLDTLSNQQSIALCILDLAKGYEFKTQNYYDGFILKCCELVLQYHPSNPMALLLKAETLKKIYLKQKKEGDGKGTEIYESMEKTYIRLAVLGYREMPEKMYLQWLKELSTQKKNHHSLVRPANKRIGN